MNLFLKFKTRNRQEVLDFILGNLVFPREDNVMAPIISRAGVWEKEEVDWLKANVTEGSVCLNIGSNVGYFAIQMARLTGPNGFVYVVEPNPEVIPFLKLNIENSGFKNIKVFKKAAGDKDGLKKLYLNRRNYGDSRMFDPRKTSGGGDHLVMGFSRVPKYCFVRITKIDNLIKHKKIDTVLIDTQGFDHLVLRGMQETIRLYKPKILTEFVPQWILDMGWDPVDVLQEYQDYGYEVKSLDLHSSIELSPATLVEEIRKSGKLYTNLSLIPRLSLDF